MGETEGPKKPSDVSNHSTVHGKSVLPVSQTPVLLLHLLPAFVFSSVVFARFPFQLENTTFRLYTQSPW